jgi:cytoskeletal protein CcmA (bactofilin family)
MLKRIGESAMASKTPETMDRTAPVAAPLSKVSVIGPTLVFVGELSADEDLIIEGRVEGTIAHHEKNLTVGKQGIVKANIRARSVTIQGTVHGDVQGDELVLIVAGAHETGNVSSPRIRMVDGARFKGSMETTGRTEAMSTTQDTARHESVGARSTGT